MKTEATSNTANSFSFASSSNQKYAGILEKSATKMLRKEFSELLSYVYSVSPPFMTLHYVIMFFRLLQLLGPSLNPGFLDFWKTDYPSEKTMYVFSIFFYLIPPAEHATATLPAMIVYLVLTALFLILLLVSAKVFKKKANLPSFLPPLIACYFYSLGFLLPPVAVELMFSKFSEYIFHDSSNANITRTIIILVIAVIITGAYLYIFVFIALQVLTFQPMSFITVTTAPQSLMVVSILAINAFIGLCEFADRKITAIFCLIGAVFYGTSSLLVFYKGGIIRHREATMYMAASYTGCITCIVIAVFQLLDMKATMVIIGIFIAVFVVSFFVADLLLKRAKTHRLQILDLIVDDPECFHDTVKSVNHYINLVVTGFSEVHPICLNWSFLKMGIERWPKNGDVWYTYAKFCAIYPEETQTLAWIFRSIIMNKVKGRAAKTVKEQSLSVARQREANLSPDLKTKLNSITKHVTGAKHKLRNVWDMAIQGNISDMEVATKRAIKSIKQSNGDLLHILRLFPNNRFVTRQYARFCKELLADYTTCADMIEKSRLLHRNINVNKDQTHEYGITAFPMLPEKLMKSDPMMLAQTNNNDTLTSSVLDLDEQDGADNQERDETSVFLTRIEKLRIPSTTGMTIISLLLYLIIFALPVIIILVYIPNFINTLTAPLQYMYNLSVARTLVFQLTAFGIEILMEQMGVYEKPKQVNEDQLPVNFGETNDTRLQLAYLCKQMTGIQQNVEEFRAYKIVNKNMDLAKAQIFSEIINYSYYSKTIPTYKMISVQNAISDIVSQQRDLMSNTVLATDIVNTSALLNPITSMLPVVTAFDDALTYMINYISDNDDAKRKLVTILEYVILAVGAILYIVSIVVGILWIQSNKEEAYRCLTALPKNTVSQLAENLRILKKETENSMSTQTNTETNKQEDNILKIFMTGGTNGANSHDSVYIAFLLAVIMVCQVVSCILLGSEMVSISSELRRNCPHLNYLQGVYSNIIAATTFINALVGLNYENTTISSIEKNDLLSRTNTRLEKSRNFYNLARFGGEGVEEPPFSGYREAVIASDEQFQCENESAIMNDLLENCKCYTADDLVILTEAIYHSRLVPFQNKLINDSTLNLEPDEVYRVVWALLIYPVYDIFIYPMSGDIQDTITEDLNESYNSKVVFLIVLVVIGFVFEVIFLVLIFSIDAHIRGVLKLLLHCEPKVMAQTAKVMAILDGDFRSKRGDGGTRSQKFYESVCQDLPNAFIVCSQEKVVESTNKSVERIFGEDIVSHCHGTPITDMITSDKFQGNIEDLINVQAPKVVTEQLTYTDSQSGSTTNIEATSMIINNKIVIEFRDITQTVRYNTLINEEKSKSDKLLSSILPASLVPRVQAGEKNISFAVQTATIVFMDIVSFTPWCGSLPAEKVMATLNALFRKNDNLVAKYTTMTKIKCIGDCYMAAGGVFAEVNQPAVHAKEVVNFGLDALDAIRELNGELNETLQIRVGINTGGPIVAGVLGIGKPTFEILGPAINMAQQMEHHGVPMQVHVSRSVYELIYGDAFTIKERGQIEVKNGSVITYLVNRKK